MDDLKLAKQLAKALDRAISREREAQKFYLDQATLSYEYDVKKLFKNLVHEEIGQRFAIKVLRPEFARFPEEVERFLVEARAASAVRSP